MLALIIKISGSWSWRWEGNVSLYKPQRRRRRVWCIYSVSLPGSYHVVIYYFSVCLFKVISSTSKMRDCLFYFLYAVFHIKVLVWRMLHNVSVREKVMWLKTSRSDESISLPTVWIFTNILKNYELFFIFIHNCGVVYWQQLEIVSLPEMIKHVNAF